MEKVLVVYASRMGSTREIALAVSDQLARRGLEVDVRAANEAQDACGYDAVVVGSPIYLRRWDPQVIHYLEHQAPDLAERPTWLFQSGPCGPDERAVVPRKVTRLCFEIGMPTPRTFGGNLDPARANSRLSRLVSSGNLAGDFRDWDEIRSWADGIADQLLSQRLTLA